MADNEKLERFQALLKERGLRVTHQRLAIYEYLLASKRHPSAEEIYEALHEKIPAMSLATVYKTLDVLVDMGLAVKLGFGDDVNRYDGDPEPHINLVCVLCKRFVDKEEDALEEIAHAAARATGFSLLSQRHELYGLCPECQAEADAPVAG